MTPEQIRECREDALLRLAVPAPTQGGKAVRLLTDPRDAMIVMLCDELLRLLPAEEPGGRFCRCGHTWAYHSHGPCLAGNGLGGACGCFTFHPPLGDAR